MTSPMPCHSCEAPVTDPPDDHGKASCSARCGAVNFPNGAKLSPGRNVRRAILMRGGAPVVVVFEQKPKIPGQNGEPGWSYTIDDRRFGSRPVRDGYPGHHPEDRAWYAVMDRCGPILRWETVAIDSTP